MRLLLSVVLTVSLASITFGQRGGHGGGGGGSRGGGGVSHGGAVGGTSFRGGAVTGGNFHGGTFHGGPFRGGIVNNGYRGGYAFRGGYRRIGPRFYGNYGWPYYGYGYGYGYGLNYWDPFWDDYSTAPVSYPNYPYSYAPAPSYNSYPPAYNAYPPPVQQAPSEPMTVYESPAPQQYAARPSNEPVSYLIAFKDHNIRMALAYWTEKADLRYVTMDHQVKTVPLDSVDRDLSLQLNRERRVSFALPSIGG